jgi:hypothetical protein
VATETTRTDVRTVNLVAAGNQFLEYRLKVSGARANFALVDDDGTSVLTHMNFGTGNELVWQLQSAVNPNGTIALSTPQNPAYSRTGSPGDATLYDLALLFITAVGYTLTVRLNVAGAPPQTFTDIDFMMEHSTDIVDQPLSVNL